MTPFKTAAATCFAVLALSAAPAFAGECPVDQRADNALQNAATMPSGVADDVIASIDLSDRYGIPGRNLGVLGVYVIVGPLRSGAKWAASVLTFVFALAFVMAAVTAEKLSATGAPTSWHIMGILLAVTTAGYVLHVVATGRRSEDRTDL